MIIVTASIQDAPVGLKRVSLQADRHTLAKRRWRAKAEDGLEFGFDLVSPLNDGDAFHLGDDCVYMIQQKAEPVLEIALISTPAPVARLGWTIGNLHFPIQVTEEFVRVPDDTALRQLLEREKVPFTACERVFVSFAKTHSHEN